MIYYLDTSAWIAWKFSQPGKELLTKVWRPEATFISAPILAAEYVAFLRRIERLSEGQPEEELSFLRWIIPGEVIFKEFSLCINAGDLKGADLYHLAAAAWFAEDNRSELTFLTCDKQQKKVAQKLGFKV